MRGTWSEGFRAPTIADLYGGGSQTFSFFTDPCDTNFGSSATNTTTRANCVAAMGALANTYRQLAQGFIPATVVNSQTPVPFTSGSNPTLLPETSESKTAGFVWSPQWVSGLKIAADWWNIRIEETIVADSPTTMLNDCYVQGITSRCALHTRDPALGYVNTLAFGSRNAGYREVEGYDLEVTYAFKTGIGDFTIASTTPTPTATCWSAPTTGASRSRPSARRRRPVRSGASVPTSTSAGYDGQLGRELDGALLLESAGGLHLLRGWHDRAEPRVQQHEAEADRPLHDVRRPAHADEKRAGSTGPFLLQAARGGLVCQLLLGAFLFLRLGGRGSGGSRSRVLRRVGGRGRSGGRRRSRGRSSGRSLSGGRGGGRRFLLAAGGERENHQGGSNERTGHFGRSFSGVIDVLSARPGEGWPKS